MRKVTQTNDFGELHVLCPTLMGIHDSVAQGQMEMRDISTMVSNNVRRGPEDHTFGQHFPGDGVAGLVRTEERLRGAVMW